MAELSELLDRRQQRILIERALIEKHKPGGVDHDQSTHGNWSKGGKGDEASTPSSKADPSGSSRSRPSAPGAPPNPADIPGEDAALIKSITEQSLAKAGQRLQFISENAGFDKMSTPTFRGEDTMAMYGDWLPDGSFDGYSDDRLLLQNEIITDMEAEQIRTNGREPLANGEVVIMSGLPGAGKSYLIETELNGIVDTRDYVTVNADDIKEHLIERGDPPKIADLEGGELASMVHEESSTMAKEWRGDLIGRNTNMILDITGANGNKTAALIDSLKEEGYKVTVVHADVTLEEAKASALRRAVGSGDGTRLERVVPMAFFDTLSNQVGGDKIDDNFRDYAELADYAYHYRTFPLNVERPRGQQKPTQLLWSKS